MSLKELSEATHLINDTLIFYHPGEKLKNCFIAICERHPLEDPHKVARRASKASGAAISAIAKIPYVPISLKLGTVLGPISIVGNSAGFFILEYWATAGTANDFFGPKTQAEMELFHDGRTGKRRVCRTIVIISVASLIALSSQLPTALAGVEYNSRQYKIVAGLVLLVAGALIPIRSLQLSIEQIRLRVQKTVESEITKIKAKMIVLVKETHGAFIQKSREKKVAFIRKCNEMRQLNVSVTEKTNKYTLALLQKDLLPIGRAKQIVGAAFNYTGLAIGTALAGIFEYALGEYTFDLTKEEIWDNDIAGGAFAALAVGSTAYLFGTSIIRTTQRIFNLFGNLATGKEVRNLGWQLRPKLSFSLTAIGLLIDVCALGPTYVIWGDFYDQNEVKHQLFQKTMCASLFLLLFTSTLDIIDEIVTSSIAHGTEEEQEILKINGEFQRLAALVEKSPSREFIGYLTNLEESTKSELLERMNVSANQLASYTEQQI
jgi:hypothetical protein